MERVSWMEPKRCGGRERPDAGQQFRSLSGSWGRQVGLAVALSVLLWAAPSVAADSGPGQSDAVRRVVDILEQIRSRYVEPVDDGKLVSDAVNGVLKGLDPYSKYLDPEAFRKLQSENQGRYGGVGIEVRIDTGYPIVVAAFENAPAHRAGVIRGDRISRIDDTSTEGLTLEQITQRVRGEPDSEVTFTILRDGDKEPRVVTITRAIVKWQSVRSKLIEPAYAYLKLTHFEEQTPRMMAEAIGRLWKENPVGLNGIVLDLRDNPGGLIISAVGVCAAFLPADAPVVFADGAHEGSKMRRYAKREDYLRGKTEDYLAGLPDDVKSVPMVVLVNQNSASASEIVAGALQDHKRATVLGTRTHGKGSIQQIIPFDDGSGLKLTTSYYYTPSGHKVHGNGITPDVVVEASQAMAAKPTDAAPAPEAQPAKAEVKAEPNLQCAQLVPTNAPTESEKAADDEVDCQLEQALQLLRQRVASTRS